MSKEIIDERLKRMPMFITVNEISILLGIGKNKAYELTQKDGFPSFRFGKRIIIPVDLFHEWIEKHAEEKDDLI